MRRDRRRLVAIIALVFALLVPATLAIAQGNHGNPGVIPPGARYQGLTYGEWAARWWQWAFSVPVVDGTHPIFPGGDVLQGQSGRVWFLAGTIGGEEVRDITIPAGTALFFPIINAECSTIEPEPFHGDDEASLRACANGHIDQISGLTAEIDGRPVRNLAAYRVESPLFTIEPLPPDNILGVPAGETADAVDAGIYLLLTPLPVGVHTIHFTATSDEFGFTIDTTYHIVVAPHHR